MTERMPSRVVLGITAVLLVALCAGCTHVYTPKKVYIKPGAVPAFKPVKAVKLTNAQTSTDNSHIAQMGIHAYVGSLNAWTDVALGVMKKELERQGMTGAPDGSKELKIKITNAKAYAAAFTMQSIVNLEVETGAGYKNTFEAKAGSGLTMYRACSGSVTRAVELALQDPKIQEYLTK